MDSGWLPGGPGWWRAWWWLVAWNPGELASTVTATAMRVVPPAVLIPAAVVFLFLGTAASVAVGLFTLVLAVPLVIPLRPAGPGPRVTARSQPELYGLVERVAGHLGSPMPGRVLLDSSGYVRSVAAGLHRDLRIGLPLLSVLTRTQVEALVAHELSPLRYQHPWLVLRLRALRLEKMFTPDARLVRRVGMLARLFEFWSVVEDDSDAAAISFGGTGSTAEAVVVGSQGWGEYVGYCLEQRTPSDREGVQDLDDGWRRYLAHSDIHTVDFDYSDEASEHTTLGDPIRRLGQIRVQMADRRVQVAPLSQRDQRWLAQRSLLLLSPSIQLRLRRIHWYTFGSAPAQWWVARAEREVELLRKYLEIPAEADLLEALDDTDEGRESLRLYAECRLLVDGWRLEHPAVRGVLVSPTGDRVDLASLDRDGVLALTAGA